MVCMLMMIPYKKKVKKEKTAGEEGRSRLLFMSLLDATYVYSAHSGYWMRGRINHSVFGSLLWPPIHFRVNMNLVGYNI